MSEGTGEFYQEVKVFPTPGKTVYSDNALRPINEVGSRVAVGKQKTGSKWVSISQTAGRTIEDEKVGKKAVWGGELPGDIYGDRDLKGSQQKDWFTLHEDSYGNFRIQGLMEYLPHVIERVQKASEFLREKGLPTERIRQIYQLKNKIMQPNGILYDINQLKINALTRFRKGLLAKKDQAVGEKLKQAWGWLEKTQFCQEERDLQVAERLRDISHCKSKEDFEKVILPILNWVNVATEARNSGLIANTQKPNEFHLTNEDLQRYLAEWLPSQTGIYLGRMHKEGIVHRNVSSQNWSAVGTLYDLDTISGQPLGDTPATEGQYSQDVTLSLGALEELFNPDGGNYLSQLFDKSVLNLAKAKFLKSYMIERYGQVVNLRKSVITKNNYYDGRKWIERTISDQDWQAILSITKNGN